MGIGPFYRDKKKICGGGLMPKPKFGLSCLGLRPTLVKVRGGGGLDPNRLTFQTRTST